MKNHLYLFLLIPILLISGCSGQQKGPINIEFVGSLGPASVKISTDVPLDLSNISWIYTRTGEEKIPESHQIGTRIQLNYLSTSPTRQDVLLGVEYNPNLINQLQISKPDDFPFKRSTKGIKADNTRLDLYTYGLLRSGESHEFIFVGNSNTLGIDIETQTPIYVYLIDKDGKVFLEDFVKVTIYKPQK